MVTVFWAQTDVNATSRFSGAREASVQVPAPGAGCALHSELLFRIHTLETCVINSRL